MGIHGLLLEDKQGRSGKVVELTIAKLDSGSAGISIFILDEHLLFKVLHIGDVGEENTFVEPHQLDAWLTSLMVSDRVCFVLGLRDWLPEIFEELQIFIFEDVFSACNVDFSVLVGWICVVDHVLDRPIDDELISEPWVHLGNQLVDTRQGAHLLHLISFNGVTKIILSVLELTALHILFNILNRAAVMIIEDVDNAIFVKEWDLDDVIKLIGVNLAFDGSILAVLTQIHSLFQLIEDLHFFWRQGGQWLIGVPVYFVEGYCLEWANNDNLLTESKLSGSFCIGVLNGSKTMLSPVLATSDVNPFFIGLSSLIFDLGEVPQISDVEAPCFIITFGVISVNDNYIEVPRSLFFQFVIGNESNRGRKVSAMDELDDIGGDFVWQFNLGTRYHDFFLRKEVPSLEKQGVSVSVFLNPEGEKVLTNEDTGDVARVMIDILVADIVLFTT